MMSKFFNHAEAVDWSFTSVVQDVDADQSRIEIAILRLGVRHTLYDHLNWSSHIGQDALF